MKIKNIRTVLSLFALTLAAAANAQTNIDATNKFAWCENIGWTNWRDAGSPTGAQGALIAGSFLSGFVWSENTGYLNLGDGTPTGGSAYANVNGLDFGVNILVDSRLGGLAWGENIGWVNLDDANHFVGIRCAADFNGDGIVDFFDYLDFVAAFSANAPAADFNGDSVIDFFDYLDFVAAFAAGC